MAEQQALAQLRQKLQQHPEIEPKLRQGGEPGLQLDPGLDDMFLLRWLRAESFNVDKALQRLCSHAPWRADYCPLGCIAEVCIDTSTGIFLARLKHAK
jgi:CRAL/TRIO, N-terminal domain